MTLAEYWREYINKLVIMYHNHSVSVLMDDMVDTNDLDTEDMTCETADKEITDTGNK